MSDLIRASDITATMAKVKVITEKLNTLTTELANWKIYVAVELKPSIYDGPELLVSVAKNNKQGFVYAIPPSQISKYADDPNTLIGILVDEVFVRLFKEQIRNELTGPVTRAIANAMQKGNL